MKKVTITFNGYDLELKDFDEIAEFINQYGDEIEKNVEDQTEE